MIVYEEVKNAEEAEFPVHFYGVEDSIKDRKAVINSIGASYAPTYIVKFTSKNLPSGIVITTDDKNLGFSMAEAWIDGDITSIDGFN